MDLKGLDLEAQVLALAQEVELLKVYISSKFGLDFEVFRKSQVEKLQPRISSPNSTNHQSKRLKREIGQHSDLNFRNSEKNPEQNYDEEIDYTPIKIEVSSLDGFLDEDQELLPSDPEEESVMGVVFPNWQEHDPLDDGDLGFKPAQGEETDNDSDPDFVTTTPKKRGRGRPRLHKKKTKVNSQPKTTRKRVDWEDFGTFTNLEEAKACIISERMYCMKKRYRTSEGQLFAYVCRKSASCASKRKIWICPTSGDVTVRRTLAEHDHDESAIVVKPKRGVQIKINVQEEIKRLLVEEPNMKPKAILTALRNKELELPTYPRLVYFLINYRKSFADSKQTPKPEPISPEGSLEFPEINFEDPS